MDLPSLDVECNRCLGKGELSIKLGKPNPDRDTHARYGGVWCVYPTHRCPACRGTGKKRRQHNQAAGHRIHLNADGWMVRKEAI